MGTLKRVTSKDDPRTIVAKGQRREPARRFGTKEGRPEYERVEALSDWIKMAVAAGQSKASIARRIINPMTGTPIDIRTLEKYYARELEDGLDEANLEVSIAAYKQAKGFEGIPNPNYGKIDTRKKLEGGFKNPDYGKLDKKRWLVPPVAPTPAMTIWWEKTRAGKKEGLSLEHLGPNGQPLVQQTTIIVLPSNGRERGATPILDLQARPALAGSTG